MNLGQTDGLKKMHLAGKLWDLTQICLPPPVLFLSCMLTPYFRLCFFGGPRTCLGQVLCSPLASVRLNMVLLGGASRKLR